MNPERWRQIEELYQAAQKQEESWRAAFLKEACSEDEELLREVESLLAHDKEVDSYIEEPAMEMMAQVFAEEQEASLTGRQIGHYRIVSLLGSGGMGAVYRARDERLGREVALKFLRIGQLADESARERFRKEARAISALNHPHICVLHDIGSHEGVDYLVMEYLQGETLAKRLDKGALPLNQALRYGIQIAQAIAQAHRQGVIHRDLKPANILLTKRGVKLLDFGLAKLRRGDLGLGDLSKTATEGKQEPTLTEEGTIVGTLQYMAPEQLQGKKVDSRADLFSLGAVVYEMVTGQKTFAGESQASLIAAILEHDPPAMRTLQELTPDVLDRVIGKCLAKDPDERWHSAHDLAEELKWIAEAEGQVSVQGDAPRGFRPGILWALVTVFLVIIGLIVVWNLKPAPPDGASLPTPQAPEVVLEAVPLTSLAGLELQPSFFPDGNDVAFTWNGENEDNWDIYVKQIDTGGEDRLTDDPAADHHPAWSPDGSTIAFVRNIGDGKAEVRLVPSRGGPDRKLVEIQPSNLIVGYSSQRDALAWSSDGQWLAVSTRENSQEPTAIFLVSINSGKKRRLTWPDLPAEGGDVYPAFSPDNRRLAFSRGRSGTASQIYLLPLSEDYKAAGEPVQLTLESGIHVHPVWTLDGREILFAFGAPVSTRLYRIAVSGSERMRPLNLSHGAGRFPALSALQDRLAFADWRLDSDIFRVELPGPGESWGSADWKPQQFISSTREQAFASYSHDGKKIAFASTRSGSLEIWVCSSDGTDEFQLTSFKGPAVNGPRWSPDGERISFNCLLEGNQDICVIGSERGVPTNLTKHPASDQEASWSRHGQWIYFQSDRTGDWQIWKVPAAGGDATQVTENGGAQAFESPDGESLFFSRVVDGQPGLWKMPAEGGEESLVIPTLVRANPKFPAFSIAEGGIYFFPDFSSLQFLPFDTGKTIPIISGLGRGQMTGSLTSVSPDGRWALLNKWGSVESDLMLVENFR